MSERKHGRDTEGIHPRFARRVGPFKENRADWFSDSVAHVLIAENSNAKICSLLSVHLQRLVRLRRQYRVCEQAGTTALRAAVAGTDNKNAELMT